jgi:predicted MFS family arabinose efflux permease
MRTTDLVLMMVVAVAAILALSAAYQLQTPRKARSLPASLVEAFGVLLGAVVGGIWISAGGAVGVLLRLGVLLVVGLPFLLIGADLRRRNRHGT